MASNNTSKTAHVMNLLSKNRSSAAEPQAEAQAESAPQAEPVPQAEPQAEPAAPQAEPAHTTPVAPIISSINADAAVSSQIKDALEAELEAEAPKAAPAPVVQKAAPAQPEPPEPAPVQEAAPEPEPVQEEAAPVQAEPAPEVPEAAPVETSMEPEPDEHTYINVMQTLVDEKADQYMEMFGICCCDKCRVDVRAYALNHLPPKYVVMSKHERIPRLTVYENRFASDITAQLVQACKKIMMTPHHSRKDN